MEPELLNTLANLGGMGLFSGLVYLKLRDMAQAFKGLSEAIIKMEERGVRLARPTPPGHRAATEDGHA